MMKKSEAEPAIRHMFTLWSRETGTPISGEGHPQFGEFLSWARSKGYGHYFDFRSTMGPMYDAEMWFDEAFKQSWRN